MEVILYTEHDTVKLMTPSAGALKIFSLKVIAEKGVPIGLPFWLIDSETLPSDRADRDAWELDDSVMGPPEGFGGYLNKPKETIV